MSLIPTMMILGIKKDMTQYFDANGKATAVTIIDIASNKIIGTRTTEKDGYTAVVHGLGTKKKSNKAENKKFEQLGFVPKFIVEDRKESVEGVEANKDLELGEDIENKTVSVTGTTKGKGFQGVVKRWGFHGGPKTHGQSDRWRAPGSIGSGTTPGRVYKGKKMPGRMGSDRQTILNSKIVKFLKNENLLLIKGPVPGNKGGLVIINIK